MNPMRKTMRRLNAAWNTLEQAYNSGVAKIGGKESELWLMYALNDGDRHSQKTICEEWGFPKTTLNTIIKQLEAAGYLVLVPIPGKRREMNVCLTEAGKCYAEKLLQPIYAAEERALRETLEKHSSNFIDALDYFTLCLKREFQEQKEFDDT